MLYQKTCIGNSDIQGIGLFATEDIRRGTLVWRFESGFDIRYTDEFVKLLPKMPREFIYKYAYSHDGYHYLCADDGRFMNHSETPNLECVSSASGIYIGDWSLVDIKAGDELTIDYRTFEDDAFYGFTTNLPKVSNV